MVDPLRLGELQKPPQLTMDAAIRYEAFDRAQRGQNDSLGLLALAPNVVDRQAYWTQRLQKEQQQAELHATFRALAMQTPLRALIKPVERYQRLGQATAALQDVHIADYGYDPQRADTWQPARDKAYEEAARRQTEMGIPNVRVIPPPSPQLGFSDVTKLYAAPVKAIAKTIGQIPAPGVRAFLPPALGGEFKVKPINKQDPVTQAVYQTIPYVATGPAGWAAFAASLPESVRENVNAYRAGQIGKWELAGNLALTLGPLIAPELARLGIKGAAGAAKFARTPEGRALIADAKVRLASETGAVRPAYFDRYGRPSQEATELFGGQETPNTKAPETFYHETSPLNALITFENGFRGTVGGPPEIFASDVRYLALGQTGKGAILEIPSSGVERARVRRPQGQPPAFAEELGTNWLISPTQNRVVAGVTISADALRTDPVARRRIATLERAGQYAVNRLPDGSVYITKPSLRTRLASERGALTPGEPGAEGAPSGTSLPGDNPPSPTEPMIPGALLSEQGDVIRITKKAPKPGAPPLAEFHDAPGPSITATALEPRLQPALGLLDEQGNIIDPLDPTAILIRQAFGGEIPTLPPDLNPVTVREWLPTWNQVAGQLADSRSALDDAIARRKQLQTLYESAEQRGIRTAQKTAAKAGLTGDTSNALTKSVLDEARTAVREAQASHDAAKEAMKVAHIRVVDEDIARRLAAVGVDEKVIKDVQAQFHISQLEQQAEADFLTMPGWRKQWEQVYNRLGGNLSGPVGHSARRAMNLNSGLNVWANDFAKNYLKPMQKLLDKSAKTLRFVGDKRYAALADTHRLWYVFTHPEDFRGISPAMHKLLNQAEGEGRAFYQGVRQFDLLGTEKPVGGRYLPQMWEDGIDYVERFARPRGKAFLTKKRAWKDWREAILNDQWPKELADMTPGQALEYAHRAAARQMSDFYMRRDILRQFGSRTQQPGMLPFNAPMYKGWYAKPEIVSQVDAFFEPTGDLLKPARAVLQPVKNIRYGIDFAIWGYNVLHTVASGNVQIAMGLLERGLRSAGLRTVGEFADEGVMIQHGLAARGLESPFHAGGATPLSWISPLRGIDSTLTKGLDWLQRMQYSNIMGPLRHLVGEGNVALERMTGQLTPAKMRRAMDNANALTGTSRGAQRTGRAFAETTVLGSARITRSQVATLGQLVKIGTPETIATLASYGVTIGLVGLALDRIYGDGRGYTFSPFSVKDGKLEYNSEWATVSVKGRRYALIPQAALARSIAKSMAAASQMDPNDFSTAWAQYAYTRTTPGAQGAVSASTGAGFVPGRGFSPFGGLSGRDRLLALAPMPVAGTGQLDAAQRGLRAGIESSLGLTSYSSTPSEFQQKAEVKASGEQALKQAGVPFSGAKVDFRRPILDAKPKGDKTNRQIITEVLKISGLADDASLEDIRDAYLSSDRVKRYMKEHDVSEPVARHRLGVSFDTFSPVEDIVNRGERNALFWWRAHPGDLKKAIDSGVTPLSIEKEKILRAAGLMK